MYLAPLNYDRFFKKVFSDLEISSKFIEDFFDIELEEIEVLDLDHKLTDEANVVRFDFRCKANGEYFIIDMQQWYKQDIVQRFYTYHALNTVLQLEHLPTLSYPEVPKKVKTYDTLAPVKTLIWMVHDKLGFEDDFVTFTSLPQSLETFLQENAWEDGNFNTLIARRNQLLEILKNDSKNLSFLRRNELTFAFQRNIIQNKKLSKYFRWFDFAEKTRNQDNEKKEFEDFAKDEVFAKMMQRLNKNKLLEEDYSYLRYYREWESLKDSVAEQFKKEGLQEGREKGLQEGREKGLQEGREKGLQEGHKQSQIDTAKKMLKFNEPLDKIAAYTGLSQEDIQRLL